MLSCQDLAHDHASDYIDGRLGWRRRAAVWLHLLLCVHCRRFIAQLRRVPALLRSGRPAPEPPEAVARALGGRLAAAYRESGGPAAEKNPPPL